MSARRLQGWFALVGIAVAVLAVIAAVGYSPLPRGAPTAAWLLHPMLFSLGALGGVLTVQRRREIEELRWQIANDESATRAEREHAHREAEGELKKVGATFLLAPTALGLLLVYQFRDPERFTVADLLAVSPMLGFLVVLAVLGLRRSERG